MTIVARGLGRGSSGSIVTYGLGSRLVGVISIPVCQENDVVQILLENNVAEYDIEVVTRDYEFDISVVEFSIEASVQEFEKIIEVLCDDVLDLDRR
jgi:hypothetical protein